MYCPLLLNLGLWIFSSAQGKVSDCCSFPSLWVLCSPREHCRAGHRHLQLAHETTKQIKTPRSFPENSFAVTAQPVTKPSLCSLAPETSALTSSGSTLQTNELKCPSNSMTDNTWTYCLPLLLIFVLAFTSYEHSSFWQLRRWGSRSWGSGNPSCWWGSNHHNCLHLRNSALCHGLIQHGHTVCLKPSHGYCNLFQVKSQTFPPLAFQCMNFFSNKIGINPNSEF